MSRSRTSYTALTVLSPIIGGHTHGAVHAAEIRTAVARLPQGSRSPFARIGMLHFARLVVLDDVRIQGMPAREDHLRSKYLLFTADFNGDLSGFAETMAREAGEFVSTIWSHCIGFPGVADPAAFASYLKRCEVPTTFPFGAYVDSTPSDVLAALDAQRRLIDFLRQHQGAAAGDLQQGFRTFVDELRHAPVPTPGSI